MTQHPTCTLAEAYIYKIVCRELDHGQLFTYYLAHTNTFANLEDVAAEFARLQPDIILTAIEEVDLGYVLTEQQGDTPQ